MNIIKPNRLKQHKGARFAKLCAYFMCLKRVCFVWRPVCFSGLTDKSELFPGLVHWNLRVLFFHLRKLKHETTFLRILFCCCFYKERKNASKATVVPSCKRNFCLEMKFFFQHESLQQPLRSAIETHNTATLSWQLLSKILKIIANAFNILQCWTGYHNRAWNFNWSMLYLRLIPKRTVVTIVRSLTSDERSYIPQTVTFKLINWLTQFGMEVGGR